mmetsp:Transcript_21407/g.42866  ORF Transcript_21407/g.42866 Transcript_21407/m.42866 type:complete len:259 (+) Transcript_21407:87-863(+)
MSDVDDDADTPHQIGAPQAATGIGGVGGGGETTLSDFGLFSWPGGSTLIHFGTYQSPLEIIGESTYAYFLIPNVWAFFVASLVIAFQLYLFYILWDDSAEDEDQQAIVKDGEYIAGLIGGCVMLALRILPNLGQSLEILAMGLGLSTRNFYDKKGIKKFEGIKKCDCALIFVALTKLAVEVACVVVGLRFSLNRGSTIRATVTLTTVALFVEAIDERMYAFYHYWGNPKWVAWADAVVINKYGTISGGESDPISGVVM